MSAGRALAEPCVARHALGSGWPERSRVYRSVVRDLIMNMHITPTYSVVVPLFNEEEVVSLLIDGLQKVADTDPRLVEIVLVDDGSRDSTAEIAAGRMASDERIRLIRHEANRGLGAAIRTGFGGASGDLVLYTDADLPFDLDLIPQLIDRAGKDRVIAGYRLNRGEGLKRWVLTKGYNLMISAVFGLRMRDVNFACKVFPRSFLRRSNLAAEGSFIDVEMMLECLRHGLKTVEFPLVYYPRERGCSTLSRPAVILGILSEMFAYIKRRISERSGLQAMDRNAGAVNTSEVPARGLID